MKIEEASQVGSFPASDNVRGRFEFTFGLFLKFVRFAMHSLLAKLTSGVPEIRQSPTNTLRTTISNHYFKFE